MNVTEDTFKSWAKGPSKTEEEKCARAESAVRKAIESDAILASRSLSIFAQGSYRNRTNVRIESDVDICVCCRDVFFSDYPKGTTRETFNNVAGGYPYPEFKNDVERALVNYFGRTSVKRGQKAFDVSENTYRVEADVVPTFEHQRYRFKQGGGHYILKGVELRPDDGGSIVNWPDQAYESGVEKRNNTGYRYKKIIRILKKLRYKMQDDGISEANDIASFWIECLVWNTPNSYFNNATLTDDIRQVLAFLILNADHEDRCENWVEVSQLKWLFKGTKPWTRDQAYQFIRASWNYLDC